MNNKYEDREIRAEGRFFEWFDNFWFYHKWHVLAALFALFVLTVCIAQSCTREKSDVVVMYAGAYHYSANETLVVKDELKSVLPKDFNGDGNMVVGLVTYHVMTAEQLEEYQKLLQGEAEEGEIFDRVDTSYFTEQSKLCDSYLMTGECAVLLVDQSIYERLVADEGRLRKLSDVFGTVPESAFSEYGIRFSKTALYQSSEQLGKLPEDTVLCLLSPYVFGQSSDPKEYSAMVEMFRTMGKDAQ